VAFSGFKSFEKDLNFPEAYSYYGNRGMGCDYNRFCNYRMGALQNPESEG